MTNYSFMHFYSS